MRIFILNPLISRKSIMNKRQRQPLSLAIIASLLIEDGHDVFLFDANAIGCGGQETLKKIESFFPEVLICTTSPVDRWECPHADIGDIFKVINSAQAKRKVLIGVHGTVSPQWIFTKCQVDFVARGEPEFIVKNLIKALAENKSIEEINGLSWRRDGKVYHNESAGRIENLDSLPMPAYHLLPMEKYGISGFDKPFSIMLTSRGCPYSCSFCLKAMAEGKYIAQSPERVIQEIKYLIKNFKVKSIYFQDWEFLILPERVKKIAELILENQLNFTWGCNSRADDIIKNQDLIALIKQAGCRTINLGLESASNKILKNINKNITQAQLKESINILKANGLSAGLYVLLNCPGEDKATIRETVDFINQNQLKVKYFTPAVPYLGTKLFKQLQDQFPEKKFDWDNIENYAGRVAVAMGPFWARLYLRHYKYQKKYGPVYFLKPKFFIDFLAKKL